MFRAYRSRIDPEFDSRHDLFELAREAKFADVIPPNLLPKYASDFGDRRDSME